AAAVAETQDRQERPTLGGLDLDPRSVEASGDIIEESQAAQAGAISAQCRRSLTLHSPCLHDTWPYHPPRPPLTSQDHAQPRTACSRWWMGAAKSRRPSRPVPVRERHKYG